MTELLDEEFEILFCGLAGINDYAKQLSEQSEKMRKESEQILNIVNSAYEKLMKMKNEKVEVI